MRNASEGVEGGCMNACEPPQAMRSLNFVESWPNRSYLPTGYDAQL
jgi:hypothetical protein